MTWFKCSALCALQLWNPSSSAPNIVHADKKLPSSCVIFTSIYFDKECHWYLYFTFALIFKELKNINFFFFFFFYCCVSGEVSYLVGWNEKMIIHSFIHTTEVPSFLELSSEGKPKVKILMYRLIRIHTKEKIEQNKYRMMGDYIWYHV